MLSPNFGPQNLIHLLISSSWLAILCLGQELCGKLEIHKQKWVAGPGVRELGPAERSADLQECLHRCCALPDCSAVSFSGFLLASGPGSTSNSASCALFACPGGDGACPVADNTNGTESAGVDDGGGLLSVRLRGRKVPPKTSTTAVSRQPTTSRATTTVSEASTTTTPPEDEGNSGKPDIIAQRGQILRLGSDEDGEEEEEGPNRTNGGKRKGAQSSTSSTRNTTNSSIDKANSPPRRKSLLDLNSWDERFPLRADQTPVWAIGLALVATVVCLGFLATLLCTVLCYRRHKLRMRTTEFSGGPKKMPTLHAFNPT